MSTLSRIALAALAVLTVAFVSGQSCGNGHLDALLNGEKMCTYVRSNHDVGNDPETCDTDDAAAFGKFNCGCGSEVSCKASANACQSESDGMVLTTKTGTGAAEKLARGKQLAFRVATSRNNEATFMPGATDGLGNPLQPPPVDACMYSSFALNAQGQETEDMEEAAGCLLRAADYTTYTFLTYCANTGDGVDRDSADTTDVKIYPNQTASLQTVGDRLDDSSENFRQFGHKCRYGATFRVMNAVFGDMSWDRELPMMNSDGSDVIPRAWKAQSIGTPAAMDFPSMYKMCLRFDDPNWPSILDSSGEFIAQTTRVTYHLECHDADQFAAHPDPDNYCEDKVNGSFGDPTSSGHHCTRLGGMKHPCDPLTRQWEPMICDKADADGASCVAAESSHVTVRAIAPHFSGVAGDERSPKWGSEPLTDGTSFVFEHDNTATSNPFECGNKVLDNIRLYKHGYMRGDSTQAQNAYICSDGGRSSECASNKGEMHHSLNTCWEDSTDEDKEPGMVAGIDRKHWCDLTDCYQEADTAGVRAECDKDSTADKCKPYVDDLKYCDGTRCWVAAAADRVQCASVADDAKCAPYEEGSVYSIEQDLLTYSRECKKELRMRVNKGVSGQIMFRFVAKVYSSQVDETDPWKGYVSQRSTLIPMAIKAVTKTLELGVDMETLGHKGLAHADAYEFGYADGVSGSPTNKETGSFRLFATPDATSPDKNPFATMQTHQNIKINDQTASVTNHMSKFSRSTRAYVEFIDCTQTAEQYSLAADQNSWLPRFRITSGQSSHSTEQFYGDYNYSYPCWDNGVERTGDKHCRQYHQKDPNGFDMTVKQATELDPVVHYRSFGERGKSFWNSSNALDNFHESYPGMAQDGDKPGQCWQTRIQLFETSSCDVLTITSEKFYTRVLPRNTLGTGPDNTTQAQVPAITIDQPKKVFSEDEMFYLDLDVQHNGLARDSSHFYFSHIDIIDEFEAEETANDGSGFDVFCYSDTVGARGGANDMLDSSDGGVAKLSSKVNGKTVWRSFANKCTRYIHEQIGANSPKAGGFMMQDSNGDSALANDFSTAEECLENARRKGKAIWGGESDSGNRRGCWIRSKRKDTRNNKLTVKLYTFDGDPAVWHKDDQDPNKGFQVAQASVVFAFVPGITRYDQFEVKQSKTVAASSTVTENNQLVFPLSTAYPATEGIFVPLPLRDEVKLSASGSAVTVALCTYRNDGTSNAAKIDEYDATPPDRDRMCDSTVEFNTCNQSDTTTRCFGFTALPSQTGCAPVAGYVVSCVSTGDPVRSSRMKLDTVVLFDESLSTGSDPLADNSPAWGTGKMDMPEAVDYHPAGNNSASSDIAWYRVEASGINNNAVDKVGWCTDAASNIVVTEGNPRSVSLVDYDSIVGTGFCDITNKGKAASTPDGQNNVAFAAEALQNSYEEKSENYWILHRSDEKLAVQRDALRLQGLSHFNTEQSKPNPVGLRVVAVSLDELAIHSDINSANVTAKAYSSSNPDQGAQNIAFDSHVDNYVADPQDSGWGESRIVDGKQQWVAYNEERTTTGTYTDAARTWDTANTDMSEINLQKDVDCQTVNDYEEEQGELPASSTICLDRLRFNETSTFHDQHSGLVKIKVSFRKTCGPNASTTWHDAGGLFETSVRYMDDYTYKGSPAPGNGTFYLRESWRQQLDTTCDPADENSACDFDSCPAVDNHALSNKGKACMVVNQGDLLSAQTIGSKNIFPPYSTISPTGAGYPLNISANGDTGFQSRHYGDTASLCTMTLVDEDERLTGDDEAAATIRSTSCIHASALAKDVIGHNTRTWQNLQTTRPLSGDCPKEYNPPVNGAYDPAVVAHGLKCDTDAQGNLLSLVERVIAMNTRLELPERWSNCLLFKIEVSVSNEDREFMDPYGSLLSWGSQQTSTDYTSTATLYSEIMPRARVPYHYFEPDLQRDRLCVGRNQAWLDGQSAELKAHFIASCNTTGEYMFGVQGHNGIKIKNNDPDTGGRSVKYIGNWSDPVQAEKMEAKNIGLVVGSADSEVTMVAGYATQFKSAGGSHNTDNEAEARVVYGDIDVYDTSEMAAYRWDEYRKELDVSGEVTYLTIESKFDKITTPNVDKEKQYFCVYLCAGNEVKNGGCPKDKLMRIRPVPEVATTSLNPVPYSKETGKTADWTKYNVNVDKCPEQWDVCDNTAVYTTLLAKEACIIAQRRDKCDRYGNLLKDRFGRDPGLSLTCGKYTEGALDNPGSRYSLMCTSHAAGYPGGQAGHCLEFSQVYIVYHKEQHTDDLIEWKMWSRSDWQKEGIGFQHTALTTYIKMRPSITLSTVSIASQNEGTYGTCEKDGTWCCDASDPTTPCPLGAFGSPVQPKMHAEYNNRATNQMLQLTMWESQFHGKPDECASVVHANVDNATSDSRREQFLQCGLGLPLRFPDPALRLVIPSKVSVSLRSLGTDWVPTPCDVASTDSYTGDGCMIDGGGFYTWDDQQGVRKALRAMRADELAQGVSVRCKMDQISSQGVAHCAERLVSVEDQSVASTLHPIASTVLSGLISSNDVVNMKGNVTDLPTPSHSGGVVSWAIGEHMEKKRVWLGGSDTTAHSLLDYSFDNRICEPDRVFQIRMEEAVGFNPESVDSLYSTVSVNVRDNDFYGRFHLARKITTPFNGFVAAQPIVWPVEGHINMGADHELADGSNGLQMKAWKSQSNPQALEFYVEHARHESQSVIYPDQGIGLEGTLPESYEDGATRYSGWDSHLERILPSKICIKVDLTGAPALSAGDWTMSHVPVEGNGKEQATASASSKTGAQVVANSNLYCIEFDGCSPRDTENCHTYWNQNTTDTAEPKRNTCTCAGRMPASDFEHRTTRDLGFKWMRVGFHGVPGNAASDCKFTTDQAVKFTIHSVYYPEAQQQINAQLAGQWGPDFAGNAIQDNTVTCPQKILPEKDSASIKWTLQAGEDATTIQKTRPWRVGFMGFDPDIEQHFDAPLSWMGNLKATEDATKSQDVLAATSPLYYDVNATDNAFVTFPETEHSKCAPNEAGIVECEPREIRVHLCLNDQLAFAAAKNALAPDASFTWSETNWKPGGQAMSFWVDVQDSAQSYAQVGDFYELICPEDEMIAGVMKDPIAARTRAPGTTKARCSAYSRKLYEYVVNGDTKYKPVPCNADQHTGERLTDVCDDNGDNCLTEDNRSDYCGDAITHPGKPYRLFFEFEITAQSQRSDDLFTCPSGGQDPDERTLVGSPSSPNVYKDKPYFTLRTVSDNGRNNLSARPTLILGTPAGFESDGMPATDSESVASCTALAGGTEATAGTEGGSRMQLRITDDEIYTANNAQAERDLDLFEATFDELKWDPQNGFMTIQVNDRYFDDGNERTLFNIGIGECPDVEALWDNLPITQNPFDQQTFGSCDSFDPSQAMKDLQTRQQAFEYIFGNSTSWQPGKDFWTAEDSTLTGEQSLFDTAILASKGGVPADKNQLFRTFRDLSPSGKYSIEPLQFDSNYGNTELSQRAFSVNFQASLEKLQSCMLKDGSTRALTTSVDVASGNTEYEFSVSVTHVQMQRKGDMSFPRFTSKCSDRKYKLTVGNKIQALSGIRTSGDAALGEQSFTYIDSMGYSSPPADYCTQASDCVADLGPKHTCDNVDPANMREMTYTAKLDLRSEVNQLASGGQVTSWYGVAPFGASTDASAGLVKVSDSNCYGAYPHSAEVAKSTRVGDTNVLTSTITFRTACLNLMSDGPPASLRSDAFASCEGASANTTNFDFKVRLFKCTAIEHFNGDPRTEADCQDTGNWFHVTMAMAFIEQIDPYEKSAPFKKLMRFYTDIDHRSGVDATTGADQYLTGTEFDHWKGNSSLLPTAQNPLPTYSADSYAVFSIGFKENSALESTMTTAIKDVSLCQFKLPCYMKHYIPSQFNEADRGSDSLIKFMGADPTHSDHANGQPTALPVCSEANMITNPTHSPLALYARNQVIKTAGTGEVQDTGCADEGSLMPCTPDPVSGANGNPLPYLTCDKNVWEEWLIKEVSAYATNSVDAAEYFNGFTAITPFDAFMTAAVRALNPVISYQKLINNGYTTDYAAAIYGNAEINAICPELKNELVLQYNSESQKLYPTWPPLSDGDGDRFTTTVGVATGKGMQAYCFNDGSANPNPYRLPSKRKVVYSKGDGEDITDPARLNYLPWLNAPTHSVKGFVLSSIDQFYMDLKKLQRNVPYHFAVTAIQYDKLAFDSLEDAGGSQFDIGAGTGRRLLAAAAAEPVLNLMQKAKLHERSKAADRSVLSVMTALDDTVQAAMPIIMPNGVAQEQPVDLTNPITTQGTGGFVITGPPEDHITGAEQVDAVLDGMSGLDGAERTFLRAQNATGIGEFIDLVWYDFPERFMDVQHFFFVAAPWSNFELFAGKDTLTIEGLKVGVGLLPATIAANVVLAGFGVTLLQASVNTVSSATAAAVASMPSTSRMRPSLRSMAKHLPAHMLQRSSSFFSGGKKACFSLYHRHFFKPDESAINPLDCIAWLDKSQFYNNDGSFAGVFNAILSFLGALQKNALMMMLFSELVYILCGFYVLAAVLCLPLWIRTIVARRCKNDGKVGAVYAEEDGCASFDTWRKIAFYIVDFPLYQSWTYGEIDLANPEKVPDIANWQTPAGRKNFWRWWCIIAVLRVGLLIVAPLFWLWSALIACAYYVVYVVATFGGCCFKGREDKQKECNDRIKKTIEHQNEELVARTLNSNSAFSVDNPIDEQQENFPVSSAHSKSYIKDDPKNQEMSPFAI